MRAASSMALSRFRKSVTRSFDKNLRHNKTLSGRSVGLPTLACLSLGASLVQAQAAEDAPLKTTPGREVRIGAYAAFKRDCSGGTAADLRPAGDQRGGILVVTSGTLSTSHVPGCGTVTSPAHILVYRPNPGFVGTDRVSFGVVDAATGAVQAHSVAVTVAP